MCKNSKETNVKECKDEFESSEELSDCRHTAYCVRHDIEFSTIDNEMCPECMADFWTIYNVDLGIAKNRAMAIKSGLTKKFPKRLEDLYIEQKGIRFIGDIGDMSRFRSVRHL